MIWSSQHLEVLTCKSTLLPCVRWLYPNCPCDPGRNAAATVGVASQREIMNPEVKPGGKLGNCCQK